MGRAAVGDVQCVVRHAVCFGEAGDAVAVDVGDMYACAAFGEAPRDRLADALRGACYEGCAAVERDLHVSTRMSMVAGESGRRPPSMS